MKLIFPDKFMWGSAASATQTEGASQQFGKGKNVWDRWFELEPERFHHRVGPQDTSQFYKNMHEDIAYLTATGHNSFRTSISWSRLYPLGTGEINPQAVDFYNEMIDELIRNGITPIINLFHFDMPMAMQEIGGFENEQVAHHFADYAASCFRLFGDRVKYWFTFNEPIVHVEGGYLYNFHYPNRMDPEAAVQVAFNTLYASALAIAQYREQQQDGKIGIALNLTPSYPRSQHPTDLRAAEIADLFCNRSFLDPAVKGEFPSELVALLKKHQLLGQMPPHACEVIRRHTVDFLGVNYY
ncbi:MAG: glycoside hydrolase family 1 protein, partial [Kluyvera sp.]